MEVAHITAEQYIRATLKQQGRTIRWLASEIEVHEDVLSDALRLNTPRRLNPARRAAAAKVLGIPDFVVKSWLLSDTPTQAA